MSASRGFATLDEWLSHFQTLHPKKIDFSLDRIRAVLGALDIARPPYRVITVGGTNGKGSCVALLESIYLAAGYSVGAFTSPHLLRFNERVRINGHDASDRRLIGLFERIDAALGPVTLSYFESSAVAAMLCFADSGVDLAILEVGMGGRLDAVNVYDADAALISSVDLDHTDWLGPDREAIGGEKAGILRHGRPAVVADRDPPRRLRAAVDALGAAARYAGVDYDYRACGDGFEYLPRGRASSSWPRPRFGGDIQIANAAACLALVDSLQTMLPVPAEAAAAGLRKAYVHGRMERFEIDGVEWLLDVAHNPAAALLFRERLARSGRPARSLAVFGAMLDKDLKRVLAPFIDVVGAWFVGPVDSERSASGEQLNDTLASLAAGPVAVCADIEAACRAAHAAARPGDRVLVFGSFYTVGPAMALLGLYSPSPE